MGYNGSLTAGANQFGLHLSVWPIFRIGHPPLFLPWSDVTVAFEKRRWITVVLLRFSRSPTTSVRMTLGLAERLAAESGGSFRLEAAA